MKIYGRVAAVCAAVLLLGFLKSESVSASLTAQGTGGIGQYVEDAVKEQAGKGSESGNDGEVKASLWEAGDVVGFLGDSITHYSQGTVEDNFKHNYIEYLYNYYISRSPEMAIEFRNLGADSYRAKHMIATYGVDPETKGLTKATIMLGMNEGRDGLSAEEYGEDICKLIDLLLADGLKEEDILLMSPTTCVADGTLDNSIDNCLKEYTKELKKISKERKIPYLDLHTKFTALYQSGTDIDYMHDSIHPNAIGEMLIAGYILEYQGIEDTFSEIILRPETATEKTEAENAKIPITRYYANGVKIKALLETLPMAVSEEMESAAKLIPELTKMGRQILKVEGLGKSRSYDLYFSEKMVGTFTGRELAEGVDISKLKDLPLSTYSAKIEEINQNRQETASYYRQAVKDTCYNNSMTKAALTDAAKTHIEQDKALRDEMYAQAAQAVRTHLDILVVESGVSPRKLSGDYREMKDDETFAVDKQIGESADEELSQDTSVVSKKKYASALLFLILVIVIAAGAAAFVYKVRKR